MGPTARPSVAVIEVALAALALLAGVLCATLLVGYLLWLRRGDAHPAAGSPPIPAEWPRVDVIVPVHDEARWIRGKLENLRALRYPATRLKVWIVDGASSDGTAEVAAAWAAGDPHRRLLWPAAVARAVYSVGSIWDA